MDAAEADLRAEIAAQIATAIPRELITDYEFAYSRGLLKAMQIVRGHD